MYRICCLVVVLALFGCSSSSEEQRWFQENGNVKVLSTIEMITDLVKEVGGEHVDAISLINGDLDPHSYELVKGDDEKFLRADVVFYNGLGLEHSASMQMNLSENAKAISMGEAILAEDPTLLLKIDHNWDPHIWMDVSIWMRTVRTIVNTLCDLDPAHAREYNIAGEKLQSKLVVADRKIYQTMQAIPSERRYLVTSHDAFHYFARRYLASPGEMEWRRRCTAPEGLSPDAHLSVADIYKILSHVQKYRVGVVFPESNLSRDSLRKISRASREQGIEIKLADEPLYGDAMGNSENYIEMMSHNVSVISKELMEIR